jgi:hypothetical protein
MMTMDERTVGASAPRAWQPTSSATRCANGRNGYFQMVLTKNGRGCGGEDAMGVQFVS